MRYSIVLGLLLAISSTSCSQNNTNNHSNMNSNQIRQDWSNIYKQVSEYERQPRIVLDFSAYDCTYQILVNDVPALISNEEGNINGSVFPISDLVLQSGPQSITIRLFPKMNADYKPEASLSHKSGMTLKVLEGDYQTQKPEAFKTLYSFETPEIKQQGIPFAEFKGVFHATVPYQLKGWSQGVALDKEDAEKLRREVSAVYETYRKAYAAHDLNKIAEMLYKRQVENAQAYYAASPDKTASYWSKLEETNKIIKMYPIEQDSMAFFGGGKLVALVRTDPEFRGKSVIIGETEELVNVYPIYLYRPHAGAPLEIIR